MKRLTAFLAATIAVISFAFAGAATATAADAPQKLDTAATQQDEVGIQSAQGYGSIAPFEYQYGGVTISVPTCSFGHYIEGSGKRIDDEKAWVTGGGLCGGVQFCNWRIDFAYADTNNSTYKTSKGATHTTCNYMSSVYRYNAPQTLPYYGKACAKLYVNNVLRGTQCHYITS
ncbi:hypothetical protein ACIF70_41970 [Actinacidiphila glaucinigra]|uniref:hypothetical protein n=1 Tax=Actinacidiphila glaucinigra TaxID=235986 RepID=UPI0037CCC167